MTSRQPRLVLIDPCLDGLGSHPYQYAAAVLTAAGAEGWRCDLVCLAGSRFPAAAGSGWRVWPVLRQRGHSRLTAFAELDRTTPDGRLRWQPPWTRWHRAWQRRGRIEAFAADVAPVIAELMAGDIVLVATASELDGAGLARAISTVSPPLGVGWHLQVHAPLFRGVGADSAVELQRLCRVSTILASAESTARGHTLRWHAPTAELAGEWERLRGDHVSVLPYPVTVPPTPAGRPTQRTAQAPGRRLRVAALGDARPEKNSQTLCAIVEAVAADPSLVDRYTFAIQTNTGFPKGSSRPADRAVAAALNALAARDDGLVECLSGPLDDAAYRRELAAADALLLAYDQDRYRHRCSAILLEAMAAGRVPIVSGGGWMARQLEEASYDHIASILAAHSPLAGPAWTCPRVAAQQQLLLPVAIPPESDMLVVDVCWPTTGRAAFREPAVRIEFTAGAALPASMITQAMPCGRPSRVMFRIQRGSGPVGLTVAPVPKRAAVELSAVRVHWLTCGSPVPLGAAGIVVAGPAEVPAALRELADHATHYAAGAARQAERVRRDHCAAAVLEALRR